MMDISNEPKLFDSVDMKNNNIHSLRLFLAISVIYSHCFPLLEGHEDNEPLRFITGHLTIGRVAVDCFFLLSGFLISASFDRSSSVFSFMARRITRIYPGFFAAQFLSIYVLVTCLGGGDVINESYSIGQFIWDSVRLRVSPSFGVFDSNPYSALNGSMWSIPFEFWCYVGTVFLGLLSYIYRDLLLIVFPLALVLAFVFYFNELDWVGGMFLGRFFGKPMFWARLLPLYLAGAVAWQYRMYIPFSRKLLGVSWAVMLLSSFYASSWVVLFPIAGGYAFLYACFFHKWGICVSESFGDFSYGTYLYGFPIQQTLVLTAKGFLFNPHWFFLIATPIVLCIAFVSWFVIEKPALDLSKRLLVAR